MFLCTVEGGVILKIRKVVVLLLIINLAFFSSVALMLEANAVVVSKVVSQTAKKSAKEAIKDVAVKMSNSMIKDYKYDSKGLLTPKDGFELICLAKDLASDGVCSAPLQLKKGVKRSELNEIVEIKLEEKIYGSGASKWGEFLDWFVPVFATGLGKSLIEYAIGSGVMALFDEIAFESLVELDYIQTLGDSNPVVPGNGNGFVRPDITLPELSFDYQDPKWDSVMLNEIVNIDSLVDCGGVYDCAKVEGVYGYPSRTPVLRVLPNYGGKLSVIASDSSEHYSDDFGIGLGTSVSLPVYKYATTKQGVDRFNLLTYSIQPSLHYDVRTTITKYTGSGSNVKLVNPEVFTFSMLNLMRFVLDPVEINGVKEEPLVFKYTPGPNIPGNATVPNFNEAQLKNTITPGTGVPLVAPGAYPLLETITGIFVYAYVDENGDVIYKTEDGRIVGDEDITVGEPKIIENPDGTLDVEKVPKPGEETTESEFACDVGFADIEFGQVGEAFTSVFPFSIPWDLKRYIDNAFSGIGSERPSVDLTFLGDGISLVIPPYFDPWISFFKGLVVILFDITMVFLFYRFMKGGGD